MSKHAIRFSADAVASGRIGTARVRDVIAGVAVRLEAAGPIALEQPIAKMVEPRGNHRELGRLGGGKMNKTEAAYAAHLDALRHVGEVLWFRFEGIKLRLADNTFYTPDFAVMVAGGALELHEVKGFMEEDANVKIKTAASQYPFTIRLVRKAKGGLWDVRRV